MLDDDLLIGDDNSFHHQPHELLFEGEGGVG